MVPSPPASRHGVWIKSVRDFTKLSLPSKDPVDSSLLEVAQCSYNCQQPVNVCLTLALSLHAQEDSARAQHGALKISHRHQRVRVDPCVCVCMRELCGLQATATLPLCVNTIHPSLPRCLPEALPHAPPHAPPSLPAASREQLYLVQNLSDPGQLLHAACICTLELACFLVSTFLF